MEMKQKNESPKQIKIGIFLIFIIFFTHNLISFAKKPSDLTGGFLIIILFFWLLTALLFYKEQNKK